MAAYLKDQKIKKLTQQDSDLKAKYAKDEQGLKAEATSLEKAKEEANVLRLQMNEATH